jgi:uncharacterized protein (DUF983 family)
MSRREEIPMSQNSLWTGIGRGARRRCPTCGQGRLFDGYLRVGATCAVCGASNADYPCDDFPPYLTIFAVGHLVVPLLVLIDLRYQPPLGLQAAIWLPATVLLCLLLLPTMKGATIGLCWALGLIRQQETKA